MTKEGHFARLKCGVEQWNAFRREFAESMVLNSASLAGAELAGVDLHRILLMESDFRGANLKCAILERTILRHSNFRGSDLQDAILDGADLFRADLSGADLRGASLVSAFLKRANLTGADLSTARGLTAAQISEAQGDDHTKLPAGLARPATWHTALGVNGAGR
ncbi:MAG TPA: pentapeptide repeat-containing protein [Candidatus Acidoferrum sp.]|nr:pentapeptide repeat-containing protein [Candidatus Acidoferrum sp.]